MPWFTKSIAPGQEMDGVFEKSGYQYGIQEGIGVVGHQQCRPPVAGMLCSTDADPGEENIQGKPYWQF